MNLNAILINFIFKISIGIYYNNTMNYFDHDNHVVTFLYFDSPSNVLTSIFIRINH